MNLKKSDLNCFMNNIASNWKKNDLNKMSSHVPAGHPVMPNVTSGFNIPMQFT